MVLFGLDYDYHTYAYLLDNPELFKIAINSKATDVLNTEGDETLRSGTMSLIQVQPATTFSYQVVYMKKNYDDLAAFDDKMKLTVDFGIWAPLALPILRGLQIFYDFFYQFR